VISCFNQPPPRQIHGFITICGVRPPSVDSSRRAAGEFVHFDLSSHLLDLRRLALKHAQSQFPSHCVARQQLISTQSSSLAVAGLFVLFEELVEQHRAHLAVGFSLLVLHHKVRIGQKSRHALKAWRLIHRTRPSLATHLGWKGEIPIL
jgi:hypothetical protein